MASQRMGHIAQIFEYEGLAHRSGRGASFLCGMAFCTDALDEEVGGVGMESWGKGYVGQG